MRKTIITLMCDQCHREEEYSLMHKEDEARYQNDGWQSAADDCDYCGQCAKAREPAEEEK